MSFMKRLAEVPDAKAARALAGELEDRFGKLPAAAARLVRIAELRARCAEARIDHVDVRGSRAVFYRRGSRDIAFVRDLRGKTADRKLAELSAAAREKDA